MPWHDTRAVSCPSFQQIWLQYFKRSQKLSFVTFAEDYSVVLVSLNCLYARQMIEFSFWNCSYDLELAIVSCSRPIHHTSVLLRLPGSEILYRVHVKVVLLDLFNEERGAPLHTALNREGNNRSRHKLTTRHVYLLVNLAPVRFPPDGVRVEGPADPDTCLSARSWSGAPVRGSKDLEIVL